MFRVVTLCVLVWGTVTTCASECPVSTPESFQLAINGRRNETGHWIAQISMEHNEDITPWDVDVKKIVKNCADSRSILLVITISETTESVGLVKSTSTVERGAESGQATLELLLLGYRHIPPYGYYKFHATTLDWDSANKECEREGAHLVVFNSRDEFDTIKKEYGFATYIWIGFHDKEQEAKYVTVLGDSLESTGYVKWRSGKPENIRSKNCGYAYYDGLYGDANCGDNEQFVCEK